MRKMLHGKISFIFCIIITLLITDESFAQPQHAEQKKVMEQPPSNHKLIIYQLLPRYFGNTKTVNKYYGSIEENGSGKFNDISDKALQEIKKWALSTYGLQG